MSIFIKCALGLLCYGFMPCIDRKMCTVTRLWCICALYLQKNVHSDKFVVYLCGEVLPALDQLSTEDVQLDVLKLFAELTSFCGELEDMDSHLQQIYTKLIVRPLVLLLRL